MEIAPRIFFCFSPRTAWIFLLLPRRAHIKVHFYASALFAAVQGYFHAPKRSLHSLFSSSTFLTHCACRIKRGEQSARLRVALIARKYPDVRNFISCIVMPAMKLLTSPMRSTPGESGGISPAALYSLRLGAFSLPLFIFRANSPGALCRTGVISIALNELSTFSTSYYPSSLIVSAPPLA